MLFRCQYMTTNLKKRMFYSENYNGLNKKFSIYDATQNNY